MLRLLAAAAVAALSALPASAALFVSGDSNIFNRVSSNSANQNFFKNFVQGTRVLVHTTSLDGLVSTGAASLVTYYNSNGYSAQVYGAASIVDPNVLSGYDAYIGVAPSDDYTKAEINVLSSFLAAGGNILLTGDNGEFFASLNSRVNNALIELGSAMRIVNDTIDPGFNVAQLQGPSPFLNGTTGFEFGATSRVTGGYGLFGTRTGNITFLAVEGAGGVVPEPATWAMLIAGFGLVGAVQRRRVTVAAA